MAFDSRLQRQIMGRFATGVTVVTTGTAGDFHGLTANAVTSVSLDPPLVLVAIDRRSQSLAYVERSRVLAVNILAENQQDLSQQFAQPGPKDFSQLRYTIGASGAPILAGTLGHVDCRVTELLPGGDHVIVLGEIVGGELGEGQPLLYFSGKYARLAT